jgi:uncharacterized protein (TIGR02757 family)
MDLKSVLESLARERGDAFLANDPLSFPRRFHAPEDREIAAFLAAALAYGRVGIILRNLEDLFGRIPEGPAAFVRSFDPRRDLPRLAGFKHRFNDGRDVGALCWVLRTAQKEAGSLQAFFLSGDEPAAPDIGPALTSFSRRMLETDLTPIYGRRTPSAGSYFSYLFPTPAAGSACKRLCMLLRWLCRPDDGVDLGLWKGISPSRLVIPLDTHTARISRLVGLTKRGTPGWAMALEVTESLRRLDPGDPVRYDFALSHLGISEGCTGKKGEPCRVCAVKGKCVAARGRK